MKQIGRGSNYDPRPGLHIPPKEFPGSFAPALHFPPEMRQETNDHRKNGNVVNQKRARHAFDLQTYV